MSPQKKLLHCYL